jgi:hypothetical protein
VKCGSYGFSQKNCRYRPFLFFCAKNAVVEVKHRYFRPIDALYGRQAAQHLALARPLGKDDIRLSGKRTSP